METFEVKPVPGAPEPYGLLAAILEDGTREWRWEMDQDLGPEAMVWQAYPGGHSIGSVILHIAGVEVGWFERFVLGKDRDPADFELFKSGETDVDNWTWPEAYAEPLSWYFDLHDKVRARTLAALGDWPAADTVIDRGGGRAFSAGWVFGHVIQHESYHGGQAVLLQKLWEESGRG